MKEIQTIKKYPDLANNITSIKLYLDSTEQFILKKMLEFERACTINELYNQRILRIFYDYEASIEESNLMYKFKQIKTGIPFSRQDSCRKPSTNKIKEITTLLQKDNISYESFDKIKKSVNTLVDLGIFVLRDSKLVVLNPTFHSRYEKELSKAFEIPILIGKPIDLTKGRVK